MRSALPGLTLELLFIAVFLAVCTCPINPLLAQNAPHPFFRQYTTDNGLASSEVYFILQDQEAFIWIATDNGINRFDGYEFRHYGVKDGLSENVIFSMQLDTLGRLWMQAMSGNLYYLEGQKIHPYWNNEALLPYQDRPDAGGGFMVEGAGETLHVGTRNQGIITISRDGTIATNAHDAPFYWQVFAKNNRLVDAFYESDPPKTIQANVEKTGSPNNLHPVFIQANEQLWSLPDLDFLKNSSTTAKAFLLGEDQYFLQVNNDVWLVEKGQVRWKHNFPFRILHAQLMSNGRLLVGLLGHQGLRVYNSVEAFRYDEATTWLNGQSVSYFLEDREGGRWYATNENGVFYAPADTFKVYDKATGLVDEKVTALAIKNDHELFLGLQNGTVWHLDRSLEKWTPLPDIPDQNFIRDLHYDQQNQRLWAGRNKWLFYFENGDWQLYNRPYHGVPVSKSYHITASPGGERLWVSNYSGFMSIAIPGMEPDKVHQGSDQRTYVVREDFSGRVWVGQPKGLFEWKDGVLRKCESSHPAFALRVEDLILLPDSTLVVATKGGGVVFWKGDQLEQISTEQGLTADMLECLFADKNGVVWAGTLNGLNRISGIWGNRRVDQITVFHGLPSNEINCIRASGDTIWVGTNKGLVCFSGKTKNHFSPQPMLSSVLVNNQSVDFRDALKLGATDNNLTIGFSAINYKMNGKIPYRYRMDGGDWARTTNRSVNFPALPPGKRFFEVAAQNEDGDWSESTPLQFVINPPWWQTWWARTVAAIAALAFVFGVYKYRIGQLKKANKIQLQIANLERSALQAQMNPHFIFNCLNSIQNYILQNEKKEAIMYLGSFASLVRSTLNASVAGKVELQEEVKMLNNYLELEKLRFKNRFTYEVKTAEGLDLFDDEIPPLLVQPYVENAVLHGISGRESGGVVQVFFEKKDSYIEVSITDNGGGFKTVAEKTETPTAHKSVGMSVTRNRLELLSNAKAGSPVTMHTLYDKNGQVAGTQVTIKIGVE